MDTCKQVCNHITESPVNRALDTQETTDSSLSIQFGGQLMERKTVIYKVRWTSKEFKKLYRTDVSDDEKFGQINPVFIRLLRDSDVQRTSKGHQKDGQVRMSSYELEFW